MLCNRHATAAWLLIGAWRAGAGTPLTDRDVEPCWGLSRDTLMIYARPALVTGLGYFTNRNSLLEFLISLIHPSSATGIGPCRASAFA